MPRTILKLTQSLLFLMVLTTACSRQGSEFMGKWAAPNGGVMGVTRNGGQLFLVFSGNPGENVVVAKAVY
jgi:hypothetical protein